MSLKYYLSTFDKSTLIERVNTLVKNEIENFNKNPKIYHTNNVSELEKRWEKNSIAQACFELFERDGLARIEQIEDEFIDLNGLMGDFYCPFSNPDINPIELKKQKRKFIARVNRQGVHIHTLNVLGNDLESIGVFVGDDFYGSGYDTDFYNIAFDNLRDDNRTNEYIASIIDLFVNF